MEASDRPAEALGEYEQLSRYYAGQEVQVRRLLLLDRMGQSEQAESIADDIMRYYKRAPLHARHQQAEWFAKAKSYLRTRPKAV